MIPDNVTLIVKAPNQQIEDQNIECQTSWTVRQLKGHLSEVYPSKPKADEQKIIYSGQLLDDNSILKDVLRKYESQLTHTMHLVCSSKKMEKPQEPPKSDLRQRNVTETQTPPETVSRPETRQNDQNHSVEMQNYLSSYMNNYGRVPPYPNYNFGDGYLPVPNDPASMANHMMMMQQAYMQYMQQYANIYAEPPLGFRRFQRPVRQYLSGDIAAKHYCPPCPQMDPRGSGKAIGHEDCLCLNVFAPKMPGDEEGCPVVFFIHGGNYRTGSAAPYGGQHFTQKDTILVTAQYRLGSLGFLSTGEIDASGNTGLFDLSAAMAWDYISFFGGDSSRITVMGHGSGGSAASLMALSPEGRSATGVAALSGTPLSPGAVRENPLKHAEALAEKTGCLKAPAEKLIICLKRLPAEAIIMADNEINSGMVDVNAFLDELSGRSGAGSRVEGAHDGRSLPPLVAEAPADSLKRRHQRVPMFTGVTSAETSRAVFGKYEKFLTTQITAVKDFIKKDLIGGLRGVVEGVEGLNPLKLTGVDQVIRLPDYYQAVFDNSLNAIDALSEIVEATGDALFNFPAYQSVREWSSAAPAFLYSFEHVGNLSRGEHFLPGLALTQGPADVPKDKKGKIKGPAHGDELAYLFEPLDEEGNPVGGEVSVTDARVRDSFVELIAKFAHKSPSDSKRSQNGSNIFGFMPFSSDKEQYLKISDMITTEKNFRFCQMGLWGGMAERVTGTLCKNILGQILNLPKLPFKGVDQITGIINPLVPNDGSLSPISGNLDPNNVAKPIGSLLNIGTSPSLPQGGMKPTTAKPMWSKPFGNLFGIL